MLEPEVNTPMLALLLVSLHTSLPCLSKRRCLDGRVIERPTSKVGNPGALLYVLAPTGMG